MAKKYETAENKAIRFQKELKVDCTTEKGVVRKLTAEEREYRIGFLEQMDESVRTNICAGLGLEYSLKLNKLKGKESAIASLRGEQKYAKKKEERKQLVRLEKKYSSTKPKPSK